MKSAFLCFACTLIAFHLNAQIKVLFDNKKAETAGNADWVPDADVFNLCYNPNPTANCGNESNPQITPTPAQSGITTNTAETFWKGGLSAFAVDCVKKGYTVNTLPYNGQITNSNNSNAQDLSKYKVYVVCEPNILFTSAEKTAILNWVSAGGGLLMIADHDASDRNNDGYDSPYIWNNLMGSSNPFGITFDFVNFSQTTSNVVTTANPITQGAQGNVTSVKFSGGTSMTINPAANSTVRGVVYKTGVAQNNSNVMVAYAKYGSGRVVAIGDSSPADDGTGDTNDVLYNGYTGEVSGNHRKLLINSLLWLAGAANRAPEDRSEMADEVEVALYPNPGNEKSVLYAPSPIEQVLVSDLQGKLWLQPQSGSTTVDIETGALPAGLYLVRYAIGNRWHSRKLIVYHDRL